MAEPKLSYNPSPGKPRLELPRGTCDTHFHVFGPGARFPYAPDRAGNPPADAPKEKLFALHDFLGVQHGVVVQSAVHGFDNSAAADLIAARKGRYVGVALLPASIDGSVLKTMHAQGFRGVRFHYMAHLAKGNTIDEAIAMSRRLAELGWHLQIHMDGPRIRELAPALKRSAVPVVIDHMGRVDASKGLQHEDFRALLSLLEHKNLWVKVSGSERISREPAPWRDAQPFARKLVAEFGDRALWGTDWPHPNLAAIPDDGTLVDLVSEMAPSAAQRQALLVDNPRRFYGFEAA